MNVASIKETIKELRKEYAKRVKEAEIFETTAKALELLTDDNNDNDDNEVVEEHIAPRTNSAKLYWDKLSPLQRKKEMKRRAEVTRRNKLEFGSNKSSKRKHYGKVTEEVARFIFMLKKQGCKLEEIAKKTKLARSSVSRVLGGQIKVSRNLVVPKKVLSPQKLTALAKAREALKAKKKQEEQERQIEIEKQADQILERYEPAI